MSLPRGSQIFILLWVACLVSIQNVLHWADSLFFPVETGIDAPTDLSSDEKSRNLLEDENSNTLELYDNSSNCYKFPDELLDTLEVKQEESSLSEFHSLTKKRALKKYGTGPNSKNIKISVIVLTYKKHEALAKLLPSILYQLPSNFEVIIVDNGCFPETKQVIDDAFFARNSCVNKEIHPQEIPHQYLQLCDNPGYAAGNNAGVKLASSTSKYVLFLNDDVVLSKSSFLQNMVQLAEEKKNAAAVGCKLVNAEGNELIEAGSIVFQDGTAMGYGRGRRDVNAPEFSYPKPVDYVSGACLLVEKQVFMAYGHNDSDDQVESFGFDGKRFPNYYEDTDLQMHIQHDLQKEVWLQPKSIARHEEHGSFGNDESIKLMLKAQKEFLSKWKHALEEHHMENPHRHDAHEREKIVFQAADLRARNPMKANILYYDFAAPNKARGAGYGRAFDNLSMIAELGHRVTLATKIPPTQDNWCDDTCIDEITGLGIEYTRDKLDDFLSSVAGFYDIVLISRPDVFNSALENWGDFYLKHPFALIYDCEALSFRRMEKLLNLTRFDNIRFPGRPIYADQIRPEDLFIKQRADRDEELSLLKLADVILPVSDGEKMVISQFEPDVKNVYTIGHIMSVDRLAQNDFEQRNGILFLGSFHNGMFYNGDAIWYFLTEIYPLVIEAMPIPLTIAGRQIPETLRLIVNANETISKHVRFVESPTSVDYLFNENRIFIAPHLYGAGIQYKVSEALSVGIPVVMSKLTYESFGHIPGCVGSDVNAFKQCVLDMHESKEKWTKMRTQGIDFIRETHSREQALEQWSKVIKTGFETSKKRNEIFERGEKVYKENYPDVSKAVQDGIYSSAFEHHFIVGKNEGKIYEGVDLLSQGLLNVSRTQIEKECPEGEKAYLERYPDVKKRIKRMKGMYSGFHHWKKYGKYEGRIYNCEATTEIPPHADTRSSSLQPLTSVDISSITEKNSQLTQSNDRKYDQTSTYDREYSTEAASISHPESLRTSNQNGKVDLPPISLPQPTSSKTIFYNIYIPTNQADAADGALEIVKEQVEQVAKALAEISDTKNDGNVGTLYYNTIGKTINATQMQSWCTAAGPMECKLISHYESAFEEVTLNEVHKYCLENPTQRVTYIHNKGSFHSNPEQGNWRRAGTMAATHKDCLNPPDSACNMCSLIWQPFPFFHTSGNFWTADCGYVSKLIPPLEYESRFQTFLETRMFPMLERNQMGFRLYNLRNGPGHPSEIGAARYASEAWISSHPDINPCDISEDQFIGHWRSGEAQRNASNIQWSMFPRTSLELSHFEPLDYENFLEVLGDFSERAGDYYFLPGLLFRWQNLYNSTPAVDSWVWTTFPDGDLWKRALAEHGSLAVERTTAVFADVRHQRLADKGLDDVRYLKSIFKFRE